MKGKISLALERFGLFRARGVEQVITEWLRDREREKERRGDGRGVGGYLSGSTI